MQKLESQSKDQLFYYGDIYEIFSNRFNNYFCNCQNYGIYWLVMVVSTQSSTYLLCCLALSFVNCHNYSVGYELVIVYEEVSVSWLFILH